MHLLFTSTSSWKLTRKTTAGFLECKRKSITVSFLGLYFPTLIPRTMQVTVTCEECASKNVQTRNELLSLESVQCSFLTPQVRETHRITKLHMLQSTTGSLCWGKCSWSSILRGQMPHSVFLFGAVKACSVSFCCFIVLLLCGFLVPKNAPPVSQQ